MKVIPNDTEYSDLHQESSVFQSRGLSWVCSPAKRLRHLWIRVFRCPNTWNCSWHQQEKRGQRWSSLYNYKRDCQSCWKLVLGHAVINFTNILLAALFQFHYAKKINQNVSSEKPYSDNPPSYDNPPTDNPPTRQSEDNDNPPTCIVWTGNFTIVSFPMIFWALSQTQIM